jgi:tellurite resistance-related uncharacterized protein
MTMATIPDNVVPYYQSPEFSETTLPSALRHEHRTKPGVWARIRVITGSVRYRILGGEAEHELARDPELLTPGRDGIVEPEVLHRLEVDEPVSLYVEFLRDPDVDERIR